MSAQTLPLREISIDQLYNESQATYQVPIYQRNYAWEKDEIGALIRDVNDARRAGKDTYFIGTLVTHRAGDNLYEVIDGQQRLTSIFLILRALGITPKNPLNYRARTRSDRTLRCLPDFDDDEIDIGIKVGYLACIEVLNEVVPEGLQREEFKHYFLNNVHLIHYQVPRNINLNHYFEVMNSRGEQLEKHEIVKARMLEKLSDDGDKAKFHQLWENASAMENYIQQKYDSAAAISIFGSRLCDFNIDQFEFIPSAGATAGKASIWRLLNEDVQGVSDNFSSQVDTFQPIIDFPNFLLIVLKITRMQIEHTNFNPLSFNLDDKELLNEFNKVIWSEEFVKHFGFNLLKAKYFLDNYIVHHSNEDDTIDNNPWKLQRWQRSSEDKKKGYLANLSEDLAVQNDLVHLLSMFEVSFTPRQRKNYLFYCLSYLFANSALILRDYQSFLTNLAERYLNEIYLDRSQLNDRNYPLPGSFDSAITRTEVSTREHVRGDRWAKFVEIYGDGTDASQGIPAFIFNYLDYKLWRRYADDLRGEKTRTGSSERISFSLS